MKYITLLIFPLLLANCDFQSSFENNKRLLQTNEELLKLLKDSQTQTDRAIATCKSWEEINHKNKETSEFLLKELQKCQGKF